MNNSVFNIFALTTPPAVIQVLPPGFLTAARLWYFTHVAWRYHNFGKDVLKNPDNFVRYSAMVGAEMMGVNSGLTGVPINFTAKLVLIMRELLKTQRQTRTTVKAWMAFQHAAKGRMTSYTERGASESERRLKLRTTMKQFNLASKHLGVFLWETNELTHLLVETAEAFGSSSQKKSQAFQMLWVNLHEIQETLAEDKDAIIKELRSKQAALEKFLMVIKFPMNADQFIKAIEAGGNVATLPKKADNKAVNSGIKATKSFFRELGGLLTFALTNSRPGFLETTKYDFPTPKPSPVGKKVQPLKVFNKPVATLTSQELMRKYRDRQPTDRKRVVYNLNSLAKNN